MYSSSLLLNAQISCFLIRRSVNYRMQKCLAEDFVLRFIFQAKHVDPSRSFLTGALQLRVAVSIVDSDDGSHFSLHWTKICPRKRSLSKWEMSRGEDFLSCPFAAGQEKTPKRLCCPVLSSDDSVLLGRGGRQDRRKPPNGSAVLCSALISIGCCEILVEWSKWVLEFDWSCNFCDIMKLAIINVFQMLKYSLCEHSFAFFRKIIFFQKTLLFFSGGQIFSII